MKESIKKMLKLTSEQKESLGRAYLIVAFVTIPTSVLLIHFDPKSIIAPLLVAANFVLVFSGGYLLNLFPRKVKQ